MAVDIQLCLQSLVSIRLFTFMQLNRREGEVGRKCSTELVLAASSLLPILIGTRIENPLEDQVWQLYLHLREIAEIVCSQNPHKPGGLFEVVN